MHLINHIKQRMLIHTHIEREIDSQEQLNTETKQRGAWTGQLSGQICHHEGKESVMCDDAFHRFDPQHEE